MREATPRKLSESLTRESKLTTAAPAGGTWTDDETKALLEFLLLHRPEDKWPCAKNKQFWESVAEFVHLRGNGRVRRSGTFIPPSFQGVRSCGCIQ